MLTKSQSVKKLILFINVALIITSCNSTPQTSQKSQSQTSAADKVKALTIDPGDNYLSFETPLAGWTNGLGPYEVDMSNGGAGSKDGKTITLNGVTYAKGLGAHADSELIFNIGGKCTTFDAYVGVDDEVGNNGDVIFRVFADGVQLYDSGIMTGASATKTISVDITGKQQLKLVVNNADGGTTNDSADWADAKVRNCSLGSTPTPSVPGIVQEPTGTAYYVDCVNGSDTLNDGKSSAKPWKTLTYVNNNFPGSGGMRLLFKRGSTCEGQLKAIWQGGSGNPVWIGAYGVGEKPIFASRDSTDGNRDNNTTAIVVNGSYLVFDNLQTTTAERPGPVAGLTCDAPTGGRTGFDIYGNYNVVQRSKSYGNTRGIRIAETSSNNKLINNEVRDNDIMSTNDTAPDNDSGGFGILTNGNDNEISYNYLTNNITKCSTDYGGGEGGALEVYRGDRNYFHHNKVIDDGTFSELGGLVTKDSAGNITFKDEAVGNVYAYNLYALYSAKSRASGEFLIVRGKTSKWGANTGTKAFNNTAWAVGKGLVCEEGCDSSILEFRNNVLVGQASPRGAEVYINGYNGSYAITSNNLVAREGSTSGAQWQCISSGSTACPAPSTGSNKVLGPGGSSSLFVNPASTDFRPSATGPLISAGTNTVFNSPPLPAGYPIISTDLAQLSTPRGTVEIGAYENP